MIRTGLITRSRIRSAWKIGPVLKININSGGKSNFSTSYTNFDRLVNFKKAITKEIDVYRDEGIPELNTEFTEQRKALDATIEVGKVILSVGKVPYRWIAHPSIYYQAKLVQICKGKSPSQIRRLLKDWVVDRNREKQLNFIGKKLVWQNSSVPEGKQTFYDAEDVIAYSHYFMSARYAIVKKILTELKHLLPSFEPKNVLDFGCGPGTCLPAVLDAYDSSPIVAANPRTVTVPSNPNPNSRINGNSMNLKDVIVTPNPKCVVKRYIGVDMDVNMLDAAKIMAGGTGIKCSFLEKTGDLVSMLSSSSARFELIMASYVFSEMASDAARKAAAQLMVEMLEVNGCIVIVENGNPQGSHAVRTARQFILDAFNKGTGTGTGIEGKSMQYALPPPANRRYPPDSSGATTRFAHADLGVSVIAPCSHDLACPLGNSSCVFSQKVHTGVIRIGSEEKYSYVVIQRTERNPPATTKPVIKASSKKKGEPSLWQDASIREALGRHRKSSTLGAVNPEASNDPYPCDSWLDIPTSTTAGNSDSAKVAPTILNIVQQLVTVLDKNDKAQEAGFGSAIPRSGNSPAYDLDNNEFEKLHREFKDDVDDEFLQDLDITEEADKQTMKDHEEESELNDDDNVDDDDDEDEDDDEYLNENRTQLIPNARIREKQLDQIEEEKNRPINRIRSQFPAMDEILKELETNIDWKHESLPLTRKEWSRVLRRPKKEINTIEAEICHPTGTIRSHKLQREQFKHVPSIFEALHRTTWGGLLPAFGTNESGPTSDPIVLESLSPLAKQSFRGASNRTMRSIASFQERRSGRKRSAQSKTESIAEIDEPEDVDDVGADGFADGDGFDDEIKENNETKTRASHQRKPQKYVEPDAVPDSTVKGGTYVLKGNKSAMQSMSFLDASDMPTKQRYPLSKAPLAGEPRRVSRVPVAGRRLRRDK